MVVVLQEKLSTDDAVRALRGLDGCGQLCSLLLDYPFKAHLSIFYVNNDGEFMQRIIDPNGAVLDQPLMLTSCFCDDP